MRRPTFILLALAPFAAACGSAVAEGDASLRATDASSTRDALPDASAPVLAPFVVQVESRTVSNVRAPIAAAEVRIEKADGTGGVEQVTDATGSATFMLDLARGPYAVTAYADGFQPVSVVGVDTALRGPIALSPNPGMGHGGSHTISGRITGRSRAGSTVLIDAASFSTVRTTMDSWSTQYFTYGMVAGEEVPIHTAAVELDPAGHLLNGVSGPTFPRGDMDITDVVLALPTPVRTPASREATVTFPATGLTTGSGITLGRNAVTVGQQGNYASTIVGVGTLSAITANAATLHVESFDGDLAPDEITVDLSFGPRMDAGSITVTRASVAAGETIAVPTVLRMNVLGDTFADTHVDFAGDTPQGLRLIIAGNAGTAWTLRAMHPDRPADLRLPHLPGGRTVDDLTITSQYYGIVVAAYAPQPFDGYTQPVVPNSIAVVSPYNDLAATNP